jgi:predicted DNA-binding transcriptional regulator AlpA
MADKYIPGVYGGSRVGYLEHEVENWLRERVRVASGQPVAAPMPPPEFLKIIPVKEVERRVGVSRVCLWRWERDGKFPSRIRLIDAEGVVHRREGAEPSVTSALPRFTRGPRASDSVRVE